MHKQLNIWLPPRELFLSNIAFPVAPLHIYPFAHSWKNMQMEWMVFVWGDALSSQFDQLNFFDSPFMIKARMISSTRAKRSLL